jgi:hypothetical protein
MNIFMGFANVSDCRESWRGTAPRAKEKHPENRKNLFSEEQVTD